jgi:hypothetical protein
MQHILFEYLESGAAIGALLMLACDRFDLRGDEHIEHTESSWLPAAFFLFYTPHLRFS